jgi:hypothetical protein
LTESATTRTYTAAGLDRRRMLGLTAVAGLGITALSLPRAAAASSVDGGGDGGGMLTVTASRGALACTGFQIRVDVTISSPTILVSDDVRLMILDGWTTEASNVWVTPSNRVADNPQYAEFTFDDDPANTFALCDKVIAGQVGFTVGLFEDGQLVAQSARFT